MDAFVLCSFHGLSALISRTRLPLYVAEARGRCAVTGAHRLHRLALAAIGRAPKRPMIARADRVATIPEFGGDAAVAGILDHAAFLAALDFPADFGGKLKMIAAVVDRPRAIRLHQDCVVRVGDQVVVFPRAGIDADVGHANDRQAVPAFGAHGAVRALFANGGGGFAIAQVAGEKAVRDDRRALRRNAFVVVSERAEAGTVFEARVGHHVDDVRAVFQFAQLVHSQKTHAREIRFHARARGRARWDARWIRESASRAANRRE